MKHANQMELQILHVFHNFYTFSLILCVSFIYSTYLHCQKSLKFCLIYNLIYGLIQINFKLAFDEPKILFTISFLHIDLKQFHIPFLIQCESKILRKILMKTFTFFSLCFFICFR